MCDDDIEELRSMAESRPEPPGDGPFAAFFEGLERSEIRFPRCESCSRFVWYPKLRCPHCAGARFRWRAVAPTARLYSWTVVRHAFGAAERERVPRILALVEFDAAAGVRLVSRLEAGEDELAAGMHLEPRFVAAPGDAVPLSFRPAR